MYERVLTIRSYEYECLFLCASEIFGADISKTLNSCERSCTQLYSCTLLVLPTTASAASLSHTQLKHVVARKLPVPDRIRTGSGRSVLTCTTRSGATLVHSPGASPRAPRTQRSPIWLRAHRTGAADPSRRQPAHRQSPHGAVATLNPARSAAHVTSVRRLPRPCTQAR